MSSAGEQDHNYSIGWADSQIIAMGIPQTIVKVLGSNIRFERYFDAILESTLILFDFKALNGIDHYTVHLQYLVAS